MRLPNLMLMMNGLSVYDKIRLIGEGSTCQVFLVSDSAGGLYAVKQVKLKNLPDDLVKVIKKEAAIHAKLVHPNIVQLREAFETPEQIYSMVLEYASGGSLESRLLFNGPVEFPEDTIVDWMCQICSGLKYLHERGIMHRDIKSQNIFLNAKNRIKIGDFGISKQLKLGQDFTNSFVGTPYYLPPELLGGSAYSTKCDMWSFGVLLYQLCNRNVPFLGDSLHEVAKNVLSGKYKAISNSYSPELRELITALLSSNPDLRPSAAQILQTNFCRLAIRAFLVKNAPKKLALSPKSIRFEQDEKKRKEQATGLDI